VKANGFLQVIPERDVAGRALRFTFGPVTQRYPRVPLAGALVVRVSLDIPEELANVQTVEAAVEAGMTTLVLHNYDEEPVT
jgi:hypothetical protein